MDQALNRLWLNSSELLLVIDRPDIPLHNNLGESDIRECVKRRKISGSTRSETGRKCRDTFTSLKKTCRKLGVSFWNYIEDRVRYKNEMGVMHGIVTHIYIVFPGGVTNVFQENISVIIHSSLSNAANNRCKLSAESVSKLICFFMCLY